MEKQTMKNDITIIFLTVNKVPEGWRKYHRKMLLEAVGNFPIVTVSRKPLSDMPGINLIQNEEICASNIYRQMLRAAKVADTEFVAVVEDDSLYDKSHFISFRPKPREFAYNICRWAVIPWRGPVYFWRHRISNLTLIAPRKYLIEALEERFEKYPKGTPEHKTGELGKTRYEKPLGLTEHKYVEFWTSIPIVNFNHENSIDPREQRRRKKAGPLRCYDIPKWGRVEELVKKFQ